MSGDKSIQYETKTLPSGIVVENRSNQYQKYCWYIKGTTRLHNEGEPAIHFENGDKVWHQHNKIHRLDGPAIEYVNGRKEYYIDDIQYSETNYWNHPDVIAYKEKMNNKSIQYETKILPSGILIENRPNKYEKYCWFIKGTDILHNEGEPAIEKKRT